MAKKSIGYVELEWTCRTCDTRNPGTQRICEGCGAPMPPDIEFHAPSETEILDRETAGEAATRAPDIHCPYCDARNPADATVCKQCGGDLTGGESRAAGDVVAGFTTAQKAPIPCPACGQENPPGNRTCTNCGSPLPAAKPVSAPASKPALKPVNAGNGGRGCLIAFAMVALIVVAGFGFIFFRGAQRSNAMARVVDAEWTRTIEVEALLPKEYNAWLDDIPGDATVGQCTSEVRETVSEPVEGSLEVCGTPYAVDQGTGMAKVVQDCEYQILAQYCSYTVNEWQVLREVVATGSGFSPLWPEDALGTGERPADRNEVFTCVFSVNDDIFRYRATSFEEYLLCTPGSSWNVEINGNGRVVSAALTE